MENCDSGFDVAIVGAGIAGSALAAYLAKSNLKILLIEKDWSEQERIVGELLQPGGVQILNQMELSHCLEGFDAQPVYGYAIFKQNEYFTITYPKIKGEENLFGRGFKNGKFLQRLRGAALSNPKVSSVEGEAKELIIEGDTVRGVRVILKRDNSTVNYYAKLTVICDGIFSGFRNQLCSAEKKVSGFFLGIILKECQLPFPFHGH
ncbi:MAG: FAD-dependent oxidoreductase, partial [Chitinophagales bacterium]|nr:FAD-dependent oxidoreductase [Chitinophagales bacterium]